MAADRSHARHVHTRRDAEVEDIVRTLRTYGVLTRARLVELSGAVHWREPDFRRALALAVASGRVKPLGDELFEISDSRPTPPT